MFTAPQGPSWTNPNCVKTHGGGTKGGVAVTLVSDPGAYLKKHTGDARVGHGVCVDKHVFGVGHGVCVNKHVFGVGHTIEWGTCLGRTLQTQRPLGINSKAGHYASQYR